MELSRRHVTLLAFSAGIVVSLVIWAKRKRWVKVGHVERIFIFPLKSGAVVESDVLKFESMGPKLGEMIDRGFAVANSGTYTVTDTHSYPRLCLVSLDIVKNAENDALTVTLKSVDAEGNLSFQLPEDFSLEDPPRFVSTDVLGGACSSVYDCGEDAAAWLSMVLKHEESGLRLIYHYKDVSVRSHSPKYFRPFGDTMDPTFLPALSHAAPYHFVTDSSVEDLNKKIYDGKQNLEALNFRPNLLIKTLTPDPYQEDRWKQMKIGQVEIEFSLPVKRCKTVNHNQKSAQKDDQILDEWLKINRRILSKQQEAKMSGPAGIFGHRYGLKVGTQGDVRKGQEVWAYLSRF